MATAEPVLVRRFGDAGEREVRNHFDARVLVTLRPRHLLKRVALELPGASNDHPQG